MEFIYESPIGGLLLTYDDQFITGLHFDREQKIEGGKNPVLEQCICELDEYFQGKRQKFTVPLNPIGTDFRLIVWMALRDIPYGELVNYGDIARAISKPKAPRAVGGANNKNPISIIVPCHRVVGSDRKMVGYGGGIWRKQWLIEHERKFKTQPLVD